MEFEYKASDGEWLLLVLCILIIIVFSFFVIQRFAHHEMLQKGTEVCQHGYKDETMKFTGTYANETLTGQCVGQNRTVDVAITLSPWPEPPVTPTYSSNDPAVNLANFLGGNFIFIMMFMTMTIIFLPILFRIIGLTGGGRDL